MNLDRQSQSPIDGEPDPESRSSVEAIVPILHQLATTLPQLEYYICQSPQGDWVLTTLRHRQQPLEITVVYAFRQPADLQRFYGTDRPAAIAKVPVVQLLFDLLAFPQIDRLIFLNNARNLDRGREISRQDLESAIITELQKSPPPMQLPPDVC